MERDVFLDRLLHASAICREFTTEIVVDSLPTTYVFCVELNCSHDMKPLPDGLVVFPDDVHKHGRSVGPLTADAVVSLLWRNRMVPQWIDISVWDAGGHKTCFELMCCGRFTTESERLYYRWTDVPPFGVKSPVYPMGVAMAADGKPVEKFSLAKSRQMRLLGRGG